MPVQTHKKPALLKGEYIVERGVTGHVKWYDDQKGQGRINTDDGRDGIYVHHTGLNTPRRTDGSGRTVELIKDERVKFDIAEGLRGPKCVNVELI